MQARLAGISHLFNKPMNAPDTIRLIGRILLDQDIKQGGAGRPGRTGSYGG